MIWMRMAPDMFIYLNAWSPLTGSVWEGLGGVARLEEVCQWECLWSFKSPSHPIGSLCLVVVISKRNSNYCFNTMPACWPVLPPWSRTQTLELLNPNKLSCKFLWSWCFFTVVEKKLERFCPILVIYVVHKYKYIEQILVFFPPYLYHVM